MFGLAVAALFPFGPPPGPVEPAPKRADRPWRTLVPAPAGITPKTFDLPQGVLLAVGGDLTLLDPTKGAVRWRIRLEAESVERAEGASREIVLTVQGAGVRLDPATGRILGYVAASSPSVKGPYVFPARDGFAWQGGRVLEYGQGGPSVYDEDGPVGLAYVRAGKADAWNGALLRNVVRGPGGATIGDIESGQGDDGPERVYFSRAVCADANGVWALRQNLRYSGRLVHILPSGRLEARLGPEVDPAQGLPAWTRGGIVYARAGAVYRFDGRTSRRLLTFPRREADRSDPSTARLTRWGLVRTGSFQRNDDAWTVVRLYPLAF